MVYTSKNTTCLWLGEGLLLLSKVLNPGWMSGSKTVDPLKFDGFQKKNLVMAMAQPKC